MQLWVIELKLISSGQESQNLKITLLNVELCWASLLWLRNRTSSSKVGRDSATSEIGDWQSAIVDKWSK